MWWEIVKCQYAVHNKRSHSPTERPPSNGDVSAQGTHKSFPQWQKGNPHRSSYWILKGRSLVKWILHMCLVCKRLEGRPCSLPDFRVKMDSPFTSTGVDSAGPLHMKATGNSKSTKVWICLYTCCTIQAVHLDFMSYLTMPSFLRSLKRFAARHGLPIRIVSNNGKMFKGHSSHCKF